MANTLRIKRRITGAPGAPGALKNAELAYNEVDNVLYYGKGDAGDGTATSIIQIGGSGVFATKNYVDTAISSANLSSYAKLGASNTFAAGFTNTFNGTVNLEGLFQIDGVQVDTSAAELNLLDGAIANTVVNSKAVIYGPQGEIAAETVNATGTVFGADGNFGAAVCGTLIVEQSLSAADNAFTVDGFGNVSTSNSVNAGSVYAGAFNTTGGGAFSVDSGGNLVAGSIFSPGSISSNSYIAAPSFQVGGMAFTGDESSGSISFNGANVSVGNLTASEGLSVAAGGFYANYSGAGTEHNFTAYGTLGAANGTFTVDPSGNVSATSFSTGNNVSAENFVGNSLNIGSGAFTIDQGGNAAGNSVSANAVVSNSTLSVANGAFIVDAEGIVSANYFTAQTAEILGVSVSSLAVIGVMTGPNGFSIDNSGNTAVGGNLTVTGNLTINGTTTTINSTTLSVDDKNVVLGDIASPTNTTADGGGITLKGTTDKTLNWVNATSAWTSSENFNLLTGKTYAINGVSVLSATALGSGVTSSSLTSVGTITSGTWNGTTIAVANGGTGATDAAGARTNLGLVIGTNVQAYDVELAALAGLTSAANALPYFTGSGTADVTTLSSFGRTLIDDADAAAARTTLGLVIGTNVQAYDAELNALAGLTSAADALPYFTGSGTASTTTLSSFGRTLIDDADATTARTTLGLVIGTNVQAYDAELAALAGLTSAADALPYFTGSGTATTTTLTTFGRSLIDDANAAAAQTTLGLVIGTNVQAYDAELQAIAGLTSAADRLPYFTGSGAATLATFTSFGRSLVDDTDAATARTTLGLGTIATQNANNATITGGTIDNVILDGGTF